MVSDTLRSIAERECSNELTDFMIYKKLSETETSTKLANTFSHLAQMERGHYEFWGRYCDSSRARPLMHKYYAFMLLRRILGPSFAIKYLEGGETQAIKNYESLRRMIPKSDAKVFESLIQDEVKHEHLFAKHIAGSYVKYVSFVVLGLADALVEIAGIHAGSLGLYSSTELTGLAGIIAGAAAAISMASAAYAQAKQGFRGSPRLAALYTGVSYYASAILLALPYFMTQTMSVAIVSSLVVGMVIIAFASWYNSIMTGSQFRRNFLELAGIMLAATMVLFAFGFVIKSALHISI